MIVILHDHDGNKVAEAELDEQATSVTLHDLPEGTYPRAVVLRASGDVLWVLGGWRVSRGGSLTVRWGPEVDSLARNAPAYAPMPEKRRRAS